MERKEIRVFDLFFFAIVWTETKSRRAKTRKRTRPIRSLSNNDGDGYENVT